MLSVIRINTASQDTIETELVTDEDIRKDLKQTSKQESGKNTLKSLRWFGFIIIFLKKRKKILHDPFQYHTAIVGICATE